MAVSSWSGKTSCVEIDVETWFQSSIYRAGLFYSLPV